MFHPENVYRNLKQIISQHLHAKNKLRLYNNFVLSKISWNLSVADLSKTWVVENLDNLVSKYIRQWLDLPISTTLSGIFLSKNQPNFTSRQIPTVSNCLTQRTEIFTKR